ncbi:MAG TPA: saccharopine dehydrogenase NADP-binding domain-containing protein [Thermoanaerobaculia bacterium]|nr:saccharopine dehydrogenase NADP-binding domain-containing protein [Thermoanaerobaculia bacterium]
MAARWLIYGANGYTGELVAREAARRRLAPVLAGRSDAVGELAGELDLPARVFPLGDPSSLRAHLADVDAVVHCAGPFVHTSRPMVEACLATGTHYLDVTGEIAVFEAIHAIDAKAKAAGVALVPGVGFDVVPTDCLAARLAEALPGARRLELAFVAEGGGPSRGTAKTMVTHLPRLGAIRRDGAIVPVPAVWDAKELTLALPGGETVRRWVATIPWGDVSTAYRTTGIPEVRVYTGMPPKQIRALRRLRPLLPLAGLAPVKRLLLAWLDRRYAARRGPGEEARRRGRVLVWGRAVDDAGREATGVLVTPDGYTFTAASALECLSRLLASPPAPGAWTPSRAFGADLVEAIPGVEVGPIEVREPGG